MTGRVSRLHVSIFVGLAWILVIGASTAEAQEGKPAVLDPALVTVPNIATNDPKVLADGYKFFIFHNPSIGYAQASTDIAECRGFLPAGLGRALPGFTPWVEAQPGRQIEQGPSQYGVVGDVIGAIVLPKLRRGQNSTILRRCMETRGYVRYAVAEAAWNLLNEGQESMIVAMQAKLASGSRPPQPEVSE